MRPELTADGGLASYGHSASEAFRRAGLYTHRVDSQGRRGTLARHGPKALN